MHESKGELRVLKLQPLVLVSPLSGAEPLFCRADADRRSLRTYFNSFDASFWSRYTSAAGFKLVFSAEEPGEVIVFSGVDGQHIRLGFEAGVEVTVDVAAQGEAYAEFIGGGWINGGFFASEYESREVRLALDICTYRREEFVRRNIKALQGAGTDIFVVDNASTLGPLSGATVIPNRNVGGSGGFTRGLIDIMNNGYTHSVFMDDDIVIMPETVERLIAFLICVKPEYARRPVCGAMLRLDRPTVMHECLAKYHGFMSEPIHTNLDLADFDNVRGLTNDSEGDYGAWWFCCVPVSEAADKGLPLPLFVRFDDVEYGLRLEKPIALSGAAVWHEPFERKHSAANEYYHARNALIVNALRRPEVNDAKVALKLLLSHLLRYRYIHAEMALKGMNDYIKGSEFLMRADPVEINGSLAKLDIIEVPEGSECDERPDTRMSKLLCLLTFNGLFLPSRKMAAVQAHINPLKAHFAAKEVLNVIADTGNGFIAARSVMKTNRLLVRTLKTCFKLMKRSKALKREWREASRTLASEVFWRKYLNM